MPLHDVIVLAGIVAAFSAFAIALAYGEYQTRRFKRPTDAALPQQGEQKWLKAA